MQTSRIIQMDNQSRLIDALLNNNQAVIKTLYSENYPKIKAMIQKNNGTEQDAKDIYQDAFVSLWKRVHENSFEIKNESAIGGYLYAVSKNKWMDHLRSAGYKKNVSYDLMAESGFETEADEITLHERHDDDDNKLKKAMLAFKDMGLECRDLLKMFYYEKRSMNDIAKILNLDSASTRNKKYRCMKKLREMTLKNV